MDGFSISPSSRNHDDREPTTYRDCRPSPISIVLAVIGDILDEIESPFVMGEASDVVEWWLGNTWHIQIGSFSAGSGNPLTAAGNNGLR